MFLLPGIQNVARHTLHTVRSKWSLNHFHYDVKLSRMFYTLVNLDSHKARVIITLLSFVICFR